MNFLTTLSLILSATIALSQQNLLINSAVTHSSHFGSRAQGYFATNLIDQNTSSTDWSTGWYAGAQLDSNQHEHVAFYFGEGIPKRVNEIHIYLHENEVVHPTALTIDARTTLSDEWVNIHTPNIDFVAGLNVIQLDNETAYELYRIRLTDDNVSGTAGFQEVEMYDIPSNIPEVEVFDFPEPVLLSTTGLEENKNFIYPTVSDRVFHLEASQETIYIYDNTGKLIKEVNNVSSFELENTQDGTYYARSTKNGKSKTQKIILLK